MYLLRLFHQSDPTRQVEARAFDGGELVIGRDPGVGWKIDDPDRQISRAHCVVTLEGGDLYVRDTSSNGVSLGSSKKRLPNSQVVPLPIGESLILGSFIISVELAKADAIYTPEQAPEALAPEPDSPFAPPPGFGDLQGISKPRGPDPFASELRAGPLEEDPFAEDPFSFGRSPSRASPALPQVDEDVWDRRDPGRVGDWNGPSAHRSVGHEQLIGSDRAWSEPVKDGPGEVGFGFDAPFHRPMLKAAPIPAEALLIPSDWDLAEAGAAPMAEIPPSLDLDIPPPAPLPPPVYAAPPAPEPLPPPPAPIAVAPVAPAPVVKIADPTIPPLEPAPIVQPIIAAVAPPAPVVAAPPAPAPVAAPAPAPDLAARDLLRAFCEGANLDPAEFAGEDPAVVLQRVGAIYQQMVLGLGDLLGERTSVKNEFRMARTTVAPEGNNPFKWAPARRVAIDLLKSSNDGFMAGPAAVRESFADLKKHLLCLLAGMRASLTSTLRALNPATIEGHLRGQSFVMKSNKASAAWSEYGRVYAEFQRQADDNPDSQINRDFRQAYEQQLGELDGLRSK